MTSDRDILIRALESALRAWEQWRGDKTLLEQYPPDESILEPLAAVIGRCDAYRAVAGHVLFTAYSGPVLHAPSLALPLLYQAERAQREAQDIGRAAGWLIRMLGTRQADGEFKAVIWGLIVGAGRRPQNRRGWVECVLQ
jgi:hypothetical protein